MMRSWSAIYVQVRRVKCSSAKYRTIGTKSQYWDCLGSIHLFYPKICVWWRVNCGNMPLSLEARYYTENEWILVRCYMTLHSVLLYAGWSYVPIYYKDNLLLRTLIRGLMSEYWVDCKMLQNVIAECYRM